MKDAIELCGVKVIGAMLTLTMHNGTEIHVRASEIVEVGPAVENGAPVIGASVIQLRGGCFLPTSTGPAWVSRTYGVKHPPAAVARALRVAEWREITRDGAKQLIDDVDTMDTGA